MKKAVSLPRWGLALVLGLFVALTAAGQQQPYQIFNYYGGQYKRIKITEALHLPYGRSPQLRTSDTDTGAVFVNTATWSIDIWNGSTFVPSGRSFSDGTMAGQYLGWDGTKYVPRQISYSEITGAPPAPDTTATYATRYWSNSRFPSMSGSYADPSWITGLAWTKVTGRPTYFNPDTSKVILNQTGYRQAAGLSISGLAAVGALNASGAARLDSTLTFTPRAADPAGTTPGAVWYNSTSNDFRVNRGGTIGSLLTTGQIAGGGLTYLSGSLLIGGTFTANLALTSSTSSFTFTTNGWSVFNTSNSNPARINSSASRLRTVLGVSTSNTYTYRDLMISNNHDGASGGGTTRYYPKGLLIASNLYHITNNAVTAIDSTKRSVGLMLGNETTTTDNPFASFYAVPENVLAQSPNNTDAALLAPYRIYDIWKDSVVFNKPVKRPDLATTKTAPATTGATRYVITDAAGFSSFTSLNAPAFTPTSSADAAGAVGDITRDDNFLYIKTAAGWKRSPLSTFGLPLLLVAFRRRGKSFFITKPPFFMKAIVLFLLAAFLMAAPAAHAQAGLPPAFSFSDSAAKKFTVTLPDSSLALVLQLYPDKGRPDVINLVNQLAPAWKDGGYSPASPRSITATYELCRYTYQTLGTTAERISAADNAALQQALLLQIQNRPALLQAIGDINAQNAADRAANRAAGVHFVLQTLN